MYAFEFGAIKNYQNLKKVLKIYKNKNKTINYLKINITDLKNLNQISDCLKKT